MAQMSGGVGDVVQKGEVSTVAEKNKRRKNNKRVSGYKY